MTWGSNCPNHCGHDDCSWAFGEHCDGRVRNKIAEALAAQREECAKIARDAWQNRALERCLEIAYRKELARLRDRAEKAEAELARIRKERDEARADAIRTLASALHKFAPELSLELTGKWNVAKGEAEAALEDFLAFLRSPSTSGEQK